MAASGLHMAIQTHLDQTCRSAGAGIRNEERQRPKFEPLIRLARLLRRAPLSLHAVLCGVTEATSDPGCCLQGSPVGRMAALSQESAPCQAWIALPWMHTLDPVTSACEPVNVVQPFPQVGVLISRK